MIFDNTITKLTAGMRNLAESVSIINSPDVKSNSVREEGRITRNVPGVPSIEPAPIQLYVFKSIAQVIYKVLLSLKDSATTTTTDTPRHIKGSIEKTTPPLNESLHQTTSGSACTTTTEDRTNRPISTLPLASKRMAPPPPPPAVLAE